MAQAVITDEMGRQAYANTKVRPAWVTTMLDVFRTYPYLLPLVILFLGWQIYPIYSAARLSFTDDRFLDQVGPNWIGLDNYRRVIQDELFWKGVLRAFTFTSIFLPGMLFLPMIIAIMVDRVTSNRIASVYRVVLLIPSMIPAPLIFVLWAWMYNNYIGPINYILVDVLSVNWGLDLFDNTTQPQWINNDRLVFFSLAFMEWWWGLGYHTMFFLAGLATIPRDLFDAARVDGAGEWKMFWSITFWRLLPIILVLSVIRFGSAMAVIDEYLIMGGINRTRNTYTWTVYMYEEAFTGGVQIRSYAATIGWMGALFMLVVVAFLFYVFRSRD
jgi:ABC-type sugar transport system permease subunit